MRFHFGVSRKGFSLLATLVGGASAAAAGYYAAEARLEKAYAELSDREILEAKKFYSMLYKKDDFAEPEQIAEDLGITEAVQAARKYTGGVVTKPEPVDYTKFAQAPADPGTSNIFEKADKEVWDQELEEDSRDGEKPFVISHDEWVERKGNNDQMTLTYFEADDILVDDTDMIVQDVEQFVGEDNLTKWGHGSKDNNVVYIRNPKTGLDAEIVRSKGSYAHEVMGVDDELRHSYSPPKIRKMRPGDDE